VIVENMPPAAAKKTAPATPAAPVAPVKAVPAPATAVAAAPAAAAKKPVAAKTATASAAAPTPTKVQLNVPAAAAAAAAVPETTAAVDDKTDRTGENLLNSLVDKVNSLTSQLKEVQTLIKLVSKEYDKQQKIIDKVQKKRQNAKNSPSGFAKPNKISNELCDFIGVAYGTEKSRTDITRFINAYVKEHNLNKPDNRRFIIPDGKLKAILNVKDGEEINYFILQKLISHHFPPSANKAKA
jgi:chromatin remodeling complex protein RSC6